MINNSNSLLEIDWWFCVFEDVFLLWWNVIIFSFKVFQFLRLFSWASSITFHSKKYDLCSPYKLVVPSAWESLDITLNGSLNLLYVTLIMMIKCPRIIDSGTYLAHITFSLASCSSVSNPIHKSSITGLMTHAGIAFVPGWECGGRYYWFVSRLPISKYPLIWWWEKFIRDELITWEIW